MRVDRAIIAVCSCAAILGGCAQRQPTSVNAVDRVTSVSSRLTLLTRDGCANTAIMRANLDAALRALGTPTEYQVIDLGTRADSDPRRGYPTPTLLHAHQDVFGMPEPPVPHPPAT